MRIETVGRLRGTNFQYDLDAREEAPREGDAGILRVRVEGLRPEVRGRGPGPVVMIGVGVMAEESEHWNSGGQVE